MKMFSYLPRLLCLAVALVWSQGVQASTVFWSSAYPDLFYDSAGHELDASYTFELGTFGSFIPTYQNVDQWDANWHVIDRVSAGDGWDYGTGAQDYIGLFDFNADGTSDSPDANPSDVFAQGNVAYLWAFNSKDIVPSSEWALITDGTLAGNTGDPWIIPDPLDTDSYNWNLADASTAIIGGANGVQGDGTFTTIPGTPPGKFSLQTAVVPEPGSGLLLLAAAAAHLTRRARRRTRLSLF